MLFSCSPLPSLASAQTVFTARSSSGEVPTKKPPMHLSAPSQVWVTVAPRPSYVVFAKKMHILIFCGKIIVLMFITPLKSSWTCHPT